MNHEVNYKISLEMTGKKFKGEGANIDGAIASLGLTWEQIKGKGVMEIKGEGKTYSHLFRLGQLKRIFANKTTRMIWGKRLELLLSEQQ